MTQNEYNWTLKDEQLLGRVESLKKELESDSAFARRCGLDPSNFIRFKKHAIGLGITYLRRIATVNKVNLEWLRYGTGEKNDAKGFVTEPCPNNKYSVEHPSLANDIKDVTIELLKAENKALYEVIQTVNESMEIIKQTIQQNQEAIQQNRTLMKFLTAQLEQKTKE